MRTAVLAASTWGSAEGAQELAVWSELPSSSSLELYFVEQFENLGMDLPGPTTTKVILLVLLLAAVGFFYLVAKLASVVINRLERGKEAVKCYFRMPSFFLPLDLKIFRILRRLKIWIVGSKFLSLAMRFRGLLENKLELYQIRLKMMVDCLIFCLLRP